MKKYFVFCLAFALAAVSCEQEPVQPEEPEIIEGEDVTLTVELPGDENTGFSFEGNSLKAYWEKGDELLVTYEKDGQQVREIFTYTATEKKPSGEFTNPDSQITDETVYSVQHPVNPDWSKQTGALEDLPDYLLATKVQGPLGKAQLKRQVNFFHVVVPAGAAEGVYALASLNKLWGYTTVYSAPGKVGPITITPPNGFNLAQGADFFVAVMFKGETTEAGRVDFTYSGKNTEFTDPVFRIYFSNRFQGISLDGQCFDPAPPYAKLEWTPAKDYIPGYWYSLEDRPVTSVTTAFTSPR